jgi:flagellar biosynthesis anti-sigma factor FlgM
MKINDRITNSTSPSGKPAGIAPSGQNGRAKSTGLRSDSSDQLQLSSLSSQLSNLQSGSSHGTLQVAQLTSAVASGQYQVDAAAVSYGLIQEHLNA